MDYYDGVYIFGNKVGDIIELAPEIKAEVLSEDANTMNDDYSLKLDVGGTTVIVDRNTEKFENYFLYLGIWHKIEGNRLQYDDKNMVLLYTVYREIDTQCRGERQVPTHPHSRNKYYQCDMLF